MSLYGHIVGSILNEDTLPPPRPILLCYLSMNVNNGPQGEEYVADWGGGNLADCSEGTKLIISQQLI